MTELATASGSDVWVELTENVVRTHQSTVWRYLRFLGCDPDLADDLAQETFLALASTRLPDRGPEALSGWLRGTARNLMRARRRSLRRELATATPEQIEGAWFEYARDDGGASYRAALHSCLATLSEKDRIAVDQRYSERASRSAIAARLDMSVEGVKSLLRRAKAALRTCIEGKTR